MITIPEHTYNFYALFLLLSIIIGMIYICFSLVKKYGYDNRIFYLFGLFFPIVLLFGRLFTLMTEYKEGLTIFNAGLSSYGGLMGAVVAAFIYDYVFRFNIKTTKEVVSSLPLIYGISKLACFSAGCCYGLPYIGMFSMNYQGVIDFPVFPVQLLEVITFLILFFILLRFKSNKNIIPITIISCSLLKFILDYFRYVHWDFVSHSYTWKLSTNQIFSIILIVTSIIYMILRRGCNS